MTDPIFPLFLQNILTERSILPELNQQISHPGFIKK